MPLKYENFGKYILLEKLAMGGMAEVYLAKLTGATGIAKFVAMKRILPQFSDNPDYIEMFKEEAKIAVNLNHSNVVSIFDFGVEQEQFYLVMEFVEGRNLRQILNHMKKNAVNFSIEQIAYVIKEVAAGLDHAHRCLDGTTGRPLNITHRDISPQNVMVSFEGEVKVVDFGIAKAESQIENTRAGTLKGKFAYMSPEQSEGMAVDLRTDVFSLGIVLWELLANDRLFSGGNDITILKKIRACQVPDLEKINPNVPPELVRIVKKALARDRNTRYQTASAMHKDLNRFLNTQFPDFSAQDFSIFMKTLYSDVVLENRRKFIEFSKLSGHQPEERERSREKTEITEVSFAGYDSESSDAPRKNRTSVSLDGLTAAGVIPDTSPSITSSQPMRHRVVNKSPKSSGQFLTRAATILMIGAFGLLGWAIFDHLNAKGLIPKISQAGPNPASTPSQDVPRPNEVTKTDLPSSIPADKQPQQRPTTPPVQETGVIAQAQEGVHVVHLQSEPSGAEIYLDGVKTGLITPGRVRVKANTPFTLGLRKERYLNYEKQFITRNDTSHKATLQRIFQGKVDIVVSNGGANPVVSINGREIAEKPPIEGYGIPANTDIEIKVENRFTRTSAKTTIRLKDDEKKTVHLILQ